MNDDPPIVYAWRQDEKWRYASAVDLAPKHAERAKLIFDEREVVLWIKRGSDGEFIRGAVKAG